MVQATLASTTLTLAYLTYTAAWLLHFTNLLVVRKWVRIAAVYATAVAFAAHMLGLVSVWAMRGVDRLAGDSEHLSLVRQLTEAYAVTPWQGWVEALGFASGLVVFGYLSLERKFRLRSLGLFPVTLALLMMSLLAINAHRVHPVTALASTWQTIVEVARALSLLAVFSSFALGALLSVRAQWTATVMDRVFYRVQIMTLALLTFTLLTAVVVHGNNGDGFWPLPMSEQALLLSFSCVAGSLWGRSRYAWAVRLATVFMLVALAAIIFALFIA